MFPTRRRPKGFQRPKDYTPVPVSDQLLLQEQPFWQALPDILQAQVLVMIDTARRTKGKGWRVPKGENETVLWAGTPHIRTRTLIRIFLVWSVLLVLPALFLVEAMPEGGGVAALVWALCSVFIFVPYTSRGSREVFAITTHRAFSSCRTMFCSIQSAQVAHVDVGNALLSLHDDHTGSVMLKSKYADEITAEIARQMPQSEMLPKQEVRFDHIFDIKGACKLLDELLPQEVVDSAGLAGAAGK